MFCFLYFFQFLLKSHQSGCLSNVFNDFQENKTNAGFQHAWVLQGDLDLSLQHIAYTAYTASAAYTTYTAYTAYAVYTAYTPYAAYSGHTAYTA